MSQKKEKTTHLRDTINALDSAVDQWNSITNNPQVNQAPDACEVQKKTKDLLDKLTQQLDEFAEHSFDDDASEIAKQRIDEDIDTNQTLSQH